MEIKKFDDLRSEPVIGDSQKSGFSVGFVDDFLSGGLEKGIITTVFGPSGSGKTNLAMLFLVSRTLKNNEKVIFIDTESGFSVERLKQISPDFMPVLKNTFLFRPMNFDEQKKLFIYLSKNMPESVKAIIVDSMVMHYRLELGSSDDVNVVNKDMGKQLSILSFLSAKRNIPVLLTNQVYSNFESKDKVSMVGGDLLKYSSKCLIELKKLSDISANLRAMFLVKHRSLPELKELRFEICENGVRIPSENDLSWKR